MRINMIFYNTFLIVTLRYVTGHYYTYNIHVFTDKQLEMSDQAHWYI